MAVVKHKTQSGIRWRVMLRCPDGSWMPTRIFENRVQAEKYHADLLTKKVSWNDDSKVVSLNEFFEVWKVERRAEITKGWKISQDQMYRDYIAPVIGEKVMGDICKTDIGRVMTITMNKVQSQTARHVYNLLRKLFSDAVEYFEMIPQSPVIAKFHRPTIYHRERQWLTTEQASILLKATTTDLIGPAVWLQVCSGLRSGEALSLKWKYLSLERGEILIASTFNSKERAIRMRPKQGDWGRAVIPDILVEYLNPKLSKPENFVSTGTEIMLPYETYLQRLKRICREWGLPGITPHELRHTSAELLANTGASTEVVRRWLNHRDVRSTLRYLHRSDDLLEHHADGISRGLRLVQDKDVTRSVTRV